MTTFTNLSSQPNIGPVGWDGSGTAAAMNGESWAIQTNFSSSTKLVYGGSWLSNLATVDDDGGLEITISGSNFVISCNAGNDTSDPNELSVGTGSFGNTVTVSIGNTVNIKDSNGAIGYFTVPSFTTASGPTVTSHYWVNLTENAKVLTSDTVQSSDFTFLKGINSYTPNVMNLVALSDGSGYVYDYQQLTTDLYTATIDSQPVSNFFLDTSWTSSPQSYTGRTSNSNRILNVLGTIPSTTNFNLSTSIWNFTARTFENNGRNMFFRLYKTGSNSSPTTDLHVYFYVYGTNNNIKAKFAGFTYEGDVLTGADKSGTEFTVGAQATMSHTFTVDGTNQIIDVPDWVYNDEPEGDGYGAVSTTSNGGGKPDRYPIIMTNLFNRNRSLYSIGMTHKDT